MGCYQIVISGDNRGSDLLFVLLVCNCNYITKGGEMQLHSPAFPRVFINSPHDKLEAVKLSLILIPDFCRYVIVWRCNDCSVFQYNHHTVHIFIYINLLDIQAGKITRIIE